MYLKNQRGAILIMAIGIVIFVLILGLLFINILTTDVRVAAGSENATIALYIAEAGISYALPMLDYDSSWRNGVTMNFNGGSFTVSISDETEGVLLIISVSNYKGSRRTVKVRVKMGNWPMFKYDPERTAYNTPQHYVARELRRRWYFTAGGQIRSSPAVDRNMVVFGSNDNRVYCVRAGDGSEVWRYTTGGDVVSSPCIVVKFNKVYFGSDDGYFYCLDLTNGSLVWRYRNIANPRPWQASPCFYNDQIYTASNDGYVYCFNAEDGSIPIGWPYLIGANVGIYSSPAIDTVN
ncbi:MAG: PQQ-binding-like beta-propeller repeat protein, partial [Elusimicrobia bacterium]|nr:PQQ-binding-like beta-propeller repeat protein [Elusimicrobiota bacterium]